MMALFAKLYSLVFVSLVEVGAPFIRMLALSHWLSLRELGFASALAATYSAFQLMTDFAIARFVFSAPREKYEEALASAHALSILRGVTVGVIATVASPLIASGLSLGAYWRDFALLGPVIFIQSLEHLAPRVAERDYRYGVQFKVGLFGSILGLSALAATLAAAPTHEALLASLFAEMTARVVASHVLADTPYRLKFRSPLFAQAFRFGYPLMFNGLGMAASGQGDRFIVGAMLGLPALGVYAVATLATLVPMAVLGRIISTVLLAAFYNARQKSDALYQARLRLAARCVPIFSAVYALGIITLYNIVVPFVFGSKFALSPIATGILAIGTFVRISRGEPFTTMLMNLGRTRRIAIVNLSSIASLVFAVLLILAYPKIESVLLGRLLGEVVSAGVALYLTRDLFRAARFDYLLATSVCIAGLAGAVLLAVTTSIGVRAVPSVALLSIAGAALALWTASFAPSLMRQGFPRADRSAAHAS